MLQRLVELVAAANEAGSVPTAQISTAIASARATKNAKKRTALLSALLPAMSVSEDALEVPVLLAEAHRDAGTWTSEAADILVKTVSAACTAPGALPETVLVLLELFAMHMVRSPSSFHSMNCSR